jgi:periplasmic protein TonB
MTYIQEHTTNKVDRCRNRSIILTYLSRLCVGLFLILSSQVRAELQLNGISTYTTLKADQYIAAIYSEKVSDQPEELFNNALKRRMELRIVAPNIFLRSFVQNWVYSMAINNSKEQIYKNAFQVISFTDCLKSNLVKGDILVLEYFPKKGTSLTLNYVELQTFPGEDFFNILLRTWIGSVPPSSSMKTELLLGEKEKPKDLFAAYSELSPSQSRIDETRSWKNGKNGNNSKPESTLDAAPESPAVSTKETAAKTIASPKNAGNKTATNTKTERSKDEAQKNQATNETERNATKLVHSTPTKDAEPEREKLTVASFLSKRDYLVALSEWAQKKVSYPVILTDDSATDSVNFDIVIDRNGAVKEITPTNESKSKVLNNGALKAINQSSPFPKMPPDISGDSFSFSLHFSLHRRYTH